MRQSLKVDSFLEWGLQKSEMGIPAQTDRAGQKQMGAGGDSVSSGSRE